MKISWNWLSELVDMSSLKGPDALAELLTNRGLEVESMEQLDKGFDKVITAEVVKKDKHPDADRLSVCKVATGSGDLLDIVCGAQNFKQGDKVCLAQVGASLPNGLTIKSGKIRGAVSNGMLCSEEELGLADSAEGILVLPADTPLGKPAAEVLGRKDTVFEISTLNRGDCQSHWGIAREVGAALSVTPKRADDFELPFQGSPIETALDAGKLGPQFWGCAIEGVKVGPSPDWLKSRLEAIGQRSINNIVDVTNYILNHLGQPVHCYDAELLEGKRLSVRTARKGEKVLLLDGGEVTLEGWELVIADEKKAVALAGVMGGGNSEVRDTTTRIFLEVAEFDPVMVRRSARGHGRPSESSKRFEHGVNPTDLNYVLGQLARLIIEVAGGKVVGAVKAVAKGAGADTPIRNIAVNPTFFSEHLGLDVPLTRAKEILQGLGFKISRGDDLWKVEIPAHRLDVSIREDLSEEIARTIGLDAIPASVPQLTSNPTSVAGDSGQRNLILLDQAKDVLADLGLNEVVHYSFTSKAKLARFGLNATVPVQNPMSEEQEVMTPSLLPELVSAAHENWNRHFGAEALSIRLFEVRPTFHLNEGAKVASTEDHQTGVREEWKLSFVVAGPRYAEGLKNENADVDFFDIKAMMDGLFEGLGTRGVRLMPMKKSVKGELSGLFHSGQSAEVWAGKGCVGYFGELHPRVAAQLKLKHRLYLCELDWDAIAKLSRAWLTEPKKFQSWSEFPGIERDFALLVKEDVTAQQLLQSAKKAGKPLAKIIKIFDVYRGSQVAEGMTSIAVRVIFLNDSRSLEEKEADEASARILKSWKSELGAELRG